MTVIVLAASSCGSASVAHIDSPTSNAPRTGLVLSVGGADGIAHLGAIEALREKHVYPSAIVGNSMGSLVGALYAYDPVTSTTLHFRTVLDQYVYQTENEATTRASAFGLLGALLLGPAGLMMGGVTGMSTVNKLEHQRLVRVLNDYLGNAQFADLKVPYRTSHFEVQNGKLHRVESMEGNVADAVGASVANPFIFTELDARDGGAIDPGIDRVSAVPIEQACTSFPNYQLLAINVTGEPAFVSTQMRCEAYDVPIVLSGIVANDAFENQNVFAAVVAAGRDAMRAWLLSEDGQHFLARAASE